MLYNYNMTMHESAGEREPSAETQFSLLRDAAEAVLSQALEETAEAIDRESAKDPRKKRVSVDLVQFDYVPHYDQALIKALVNRDGTRAEKGTESIAVRARVIPGLENRSIVDLAFQHASGMPVYLKDEFFISHQREDASIQNSRATRFALLPWLTASEDIGRDDFIDLSNIDIISAIQAAAPIKGASREDELYADELHHKLIDDSWMLAPLN